MYLVSNLLCDYCVVFDDWKRGRRKDPYFESRAENVWKRLKKRKAQAHKRCAMIAYNMNDLHTVKGFKSLPAKFGS